MICTSAIGSQLNASFSPRTYDMYVQPSHNIIERQPAIYTTGSVPPHRLLYIPSGLRIYISPLDQIYLRRAPQIISNRAGPDPYSIKASVLTAVG